VLNIVLTSGAVVCECKRPERWRATDPGRNSLVCGDSPSELRGTYNKPRAERQECVAHRAACRPLPAVKRQHTTNPGNGVPIPSRASEPWVTIRGRVKDRSQESESCGAPPKKGASRSRYCRAGRSGSGDLSMRRMVFHPLGPRTRPLHLGGRKGDSYVQQLKDAR
jgi:hypothetical protein